MTPKDIENALIALVTSDDEDEYMQAILDLKSEGIRPVVHVRAKAEQQEDEQEGQQA